MNEEYKKSVMNKENRLYNPTSATLLSFLIPGLGQFYENEPVKGIAFLLGSVASVAMVYVGSKPKTTYSCTPSSSDTCRNSSYTEPNSNALTTIGAISGIGILIWSMVDASRVAHVKNHYNHKQSEQKEQENKETSFLPQISPVLIQNNNQFLPGLGVNLTF